MLPEKGHAVRPVSAFERAQHAFLIVKVRLNDIGAQVDERSRFFGLGIARDCTDGELATSVVEYGADESAALLAGRASDGDDSLFGHL